MLRKKSRIVLLYIYEKFTTNVLPPNRESLITKYNYFTYGSDKNAFYFRSKPDKSNPNFLRLTDEP